MARSEPKNGKPGRARRAVAKTTAATGGVAVLVIGASAGGLDPMGEFLAAMPTDSDLAFVVIQHLDPVAHSLLPELLAKHTTMPVRPAEDGTALVANEVRVIPPGQYLSIEGGQLRLSAPAMGTAVRMPVDAFLRALAADRGKRGIGIIMSGTGTDGAEGLKALKEAGGLTLVQRPDEARHDGMPRHAMQTARPDYVLPVKDMPDVVSRYIAHDYVNGRHAPVAKQGPTAPQAFPLERLAELLRSSTGLDFSHHKIGTLHRRVERRMALHGITGWEPYLAMLRAEPAEADALAKDLLINVTRFFRDPEAFAALTERVMPHILSSHADDQPVRVWVPGCSTGEEAYSLGILFLEQIAATGRPLTLQIFATDVDEEALQVGRVGIYSEAIRADVSPDRIEKFFTSSNQALAVVGALRRAVVFSRHDLLSDPPFSRLDLVSCRNLLIYLKPESQRRVFLLLHFALRDDGVLMLGSAESVGSTTGLFDLVDEKRRIYRRINHGRRERPALALAVRGLTPSGPAYLARMSRAPSLADQVHRTMLEMYAPPAVVTNRELAPIYYFGAAHRYLRVVAGEPNQDILSMAQEGLRSRLRDAVRRAFRSSRRVAAHGVGFERGGRSFRVTIEAQRLADTPEDLVLVSFVDELPAERTTHRVEQSGDASELTQARQDLVDLRRELSSTIHDLRRTNEELRLKNEDMLSLNEEFVSANEELESSKEELQSLNEELTTVNTQLRQALEQQQQTSTDLANLLNSSAVATILLDARLRIKVFNPRMQALFSLIDADAGRPLADLLPKFADPQLLVDATAAHADGRASEREIRGETGAWYQRSVLPYRTESGEIQGAVVTFADVSGVKRAELEAKAAREYAEAIVETIPEPLMVLDARLEAVSANAACQTAFGLELAKLRGSALPNVGHTILAEPRLIELLRLALSRADAPDGIDLEAAYPNGGLRVWRAYARRFRSPLAEQPMLLLTLDDVTDERRIIRGQLQLMIDALPGAFLAVDRERRIRFVSEQLESLFGYARGELVGQCIDSLVPAERRALHVELHTKFFDDPTRRPMGTGLDIHGVTKGGLEIPLDVGLSPMPTADGPLVIAAVHDLRPQKEGEELLRKAKSEADRANRMKSRFLAAASHDLRQPLQTIGLLHGILQKRFADPEGNAIIAKLDDTVAGMTELLDTLLDLNQLENGRISPDLAAFPVGPLLARVRDEFAPLAAAKGLDLRLVPSTASIRSDRRLLARIVSNLLSNAIKYTKRGKVLLGCRRREGRLRIEVWDTGIGIPEESMNHVFEEFYRVDRTGSSEAGLGLGLYTVRRFAALLGHTIDVRSVVGKGTMIAVVVSGFSSGTTTGAGVERADADTTRPTILLIEDDSNQRDTLRELLELDGHRVAAAATGAEALMRLRELAGIRPDIVVADYNLHDGMTGLQAIQRVRDELGAQIPALIVTGDKSVVEMPSIGTGIQAVVTKPVKAANLLAAVETLVKTARPGWQRDSGPSRGAMRSSPAAPDADLAVLDDEPAARDALRMMLQAEGFGVASFPSSEAFLEDPRRGRFRCLLADVALPGIDGLALQKQLRSDGLDMPIIFVTGHGDLPMAVRAMREGAVDFLQKPVHSAELREVLARALEGGSERAQRREEQGDVEARLATLTGREREVLDRIVSGQPTKVIAADLGISERTAEHHRQNMMRKMGARSLAQLIRMALHLAGPPDVDQR